MKQQPAPQPPTACVNKFQRVPQMHITRTVLRLRHRTEYASRWLSAVCTSTRPCRQPPQPTGSAQMRAAPRRISAWLLLRCIRDTASRGARRVSWLTTCSSPWRHPQPRTGSVYACHSRVCFSTAHQCAICTNMCHPHRRQTDAAQLAVSVPLATKQCSRAGHTTTRNARSARATKGSLLKKGAQMESTMRCVKPVKCVLLVYSVLPDASARKTRRVRVVPDAWMVLSLQHRPVTTRTTLSARSLSHAPQMSTKHARQPGPASAYAP